MIHFRQMVDEFGVPVERTIYKYPYSYDPFVLHRLGKNEEITDSVYSDRIYQWDNKKHDHLCKKHFGDTGQVWSNRDTKKIERFLIDYLNIKTLKLVLVVQMCNLSSGYPIWRFDFKTTQK